MLQGLQVQTSLSAPNESGLGEVLLKVCKGPCGKELELLAFGNGEGKYGRKSKCKSCLADYERLRREVSPLTEEQREVGRQRTRAWSAANLERKAASSLAYSRAHPDRMKASAYKWRAKNPDKAREINLRWLAKPGSKEKARSAVKAWSEANPEKLKTASRNWHTENQHYWRLRAEAFSKVLADFTFEQWLEVQEENGYRCAYCLSSEVKLTMDHVIPILRGGQHTRDNIVPACKPCNSKKKDRLIFYMLDKR